MSVVSCRLLDGGCRVADAVPTVTLDADEAIILFEMLSRWNEDATFALADQAEQRVLWNLCCALEEQLAEPSHLE